MWTKFFNHKLLYENVVNISVSLHNYLIFLSNNIQVRWCLKRGKYSNIRFAKETGSILFPAVPNCFRRIGYWFDLIWFIFATPFTWGEWNWDKRKTWVFDIKTGLGYDERIQKYLSWNSEYSKEFRGVMDFVRNALWDITFVFPLENSFLILI